MSTLEAAPIRPEVVPEAQTEAARELRNARLVHGSLWVAAWAVLAAAWILQVQDGTKVKLPVVNQTLPELCYWRTMFGMDCPGCGLTRCFISAAHGELERAWQYNPMGLLLFGSLVFQIPYRPWQLWRLASGRGEFRTVGLPYAMLGISALLLIQWFCRLLA